MTTICALCSISAHLSLSGLLGLAGGWLGDWVGGGPGPTRTLEDTKVDGLPSIRAHDHNMSPVSYFCASLAFWLAGLGWVGGCVIVCVVDLVRPAL